MLCVKCCADPDVFSPGKCQLAGNTYKYILELIKEA